MAYNKVSNKTQDKDISYLSKDFNSFKDKLLEFAEIYFQYLCQKMRLRAPIDLPKCKNKSNIKIHPP